MKTYELRSTSDPNLFRVVDRRGEWEHYFHAPSGRYLRGVTAILHRAWGKPQLLSWAKHQLPGVVEQKLHYGGEKGDAVHQFVAQVLAGEDCCRSLQVMSEDRFTKRELTHEEWDCIVGFANFWRMHEPKLIAHERSVANVRFGYAGSLDVILRLTKECGLGPKRGCDCERVIGRMILPDWKSGGGIWPDMFAQVSAYAHADLGEIIGDRQLQGTGIVRIGTKHKNGFEAKFRNVSQMRTDFKRFKAAIAIDDAEYKPFDPDAIYEIPDRFDVRVVREELGATEVAA
jgi:hypothetical protein